MGQQQLLLVILVTIIVGIATVVAINTFSSAAESANLDAVRNDLVSIAAAAQGYYMKPTMMGGGGRKFDNISFKSFAVPGRVDDTDDQILNNENGTYTITASTGSTFTVEVVPSSANNPTLQISNAGATDPDDFAITEVTSSDPA